MGPGYEILDSAMVYDPAAHTWLSLPPVPHPRWRLGAAVGKDGKIYVVGGSIDPDLLYPGAVSTVDCFDPLA